MYGSLADRWLGSSNRWLFQGGIAAASWKGFLSFGLVTIPIRLSPAARTERISFNQLHKVRHTRIK